MPNITIEPAPRGVDSVAAWLIVGVRKHHSGKTHLRAADSPKAA